VTSRADAPVAVGRAFFVAGAGTDVGKTVFTAALLRALWRAKVRARAVKPVQTGVLPEEAARSPLSDARVYAAAVEDMPEAVAARPAEVLRCFALPASPHLAAARERARLDCAALCAAVRRCRDANPADVLLLEGAGGLRVPLNEREDMLDFMSALGLPVLLVGGNCLGGLNHMLLSLDALRNAGLHAAAVALIPAADPAAGCPGVDVPAMLADNAALLQQRLAARCPGALFVELPRLPRLDAAAWDHLSGLLLPLARRMAALPAPEGGGEELLRRDRATIWHPYASAVRPPVLTPVARTRGNRILAADGRELVDGMSSWWAAVHGYNHPRLMAALRGQAGRMPHVMFGGLTHEPAVALAERLLRRMPAGLERIFFADSGSVAVEVALKMALQCQAGRGETGRVRFLAPRGGYHGDTFGAMSVCDPVNGMHSLFSGMLPQQLFMERPSCRFDRPFDPDALSDARRMLAEHGREIAAVILEPVVQGAGGMWFYHPDYLRGLAELCRAAGALLIFDEIATGFGRTGRYFAAEWAGVAPDILCCGKALTGGVMTLAATACSAAVARDICARGQVFMHGPTFMANPLACAVAGASLDLLDEEGWQERVAALERGLRRGLEECAALPGVADVRVLGGIGVVETRHPVNTAALHAFFVEHGVWLRPFNRLVYLMPPYITPAEDVERLCAAVRDALAAGVHLPQNASV
jgi:adenosylmethionine-8-amino-7-oxononanoate aminotransferase